MRGRSLAQRFLSPSSFCARERARCVHVSPSSPPALPAATPVTASHCVCLRKPLLPQGGLWKGVHLDKNYILVYNAKAVPPPVSGSCEPYFCPTLSAADNHATLKNRNKHYQRYQKKISQGLWSINIIHSNISPRLPQLQMFDWAGGLKTIFKQQLPLQHRPPK